MIIDRQNCWSRRLAAHLSAHVNRIRSEGQLDRCIKLPSITTGSMIGNVTICVLTGF